MHLTAVLLLAASLSYCQGSHSDFLWEESEYRSKFIVDRNDVTVRNCDDPNNPILPPTATDTSQRLADLRNEMSQLNYSAYIIPPSDAHLSGYIADRDKRRIWLSGFTGSSGTSVVTMNKAALWTDGRYFLQAEQQLDCNWILMRSGEIGVPSIEEWLATELGNDEIVGANPFLFSIDEWQNMESTLKKSNVQLVQTVPDIMDAIWDDRPPASGTHVIVLSTEYTGKEWTEKLSDVRAEMLKNNAEYLLLTVLDEIAWFFNLRGNDVTNTPVFTSYAIISRTNEIYLFANTQFFQSEELTNHLQSPDCDTTASCVDVLPYDDARTTLESLGQNNPNGDMLWLPATGTNYAMYSTVPLEFQVSSESPIKVPKSIKNSVEIAAMKQAHIYDAVALCQYLMWLEEAVPQGGVTELSGREVLDQFRFSQPTNQGVSFTAITASGPNAAVIHYRATNDTDRELSTREMYLIDSGGQYFGGTTDVTRTLHLGQPTPFEKETFTRALLGQIDVQKSIFPYTKDGNDIDVLARRYLYDVGLEYRHGTGHGVGQYLSIHEYPPAIGNTRGEGYPLQPGMFTSVEPGYYEDGSFGLRHENVNVVVKAETEHQFGGYEFYTFEPVTLVPIQAKMLDLTLFNDVQLAYLNDYHEKVYAVIGQEADRQNLPELNEWLKQATVPITRGFVGKILPNNSLIFSLVGFFVLRQF